MNRKKPPAETSRELVYRNPWQRVWKVGARVGGDQREYFVTDFGVRVGMLVTRGGEVLLVRQYRLLIGRESWEIPGGRADEGEDPATAAVRECLEETGLACADPKPLISYEVGLDTVDNPTHIFWAAAPQGAHDESAVHRHEVSGHEWVPVEKVWRMIAGGEIVDHFTLMALFAWRLLGPETSTGRRGATQRKIPRPKSP